MTEYDSTVFPMEVFSLTHASMGEVLIRHHFAGTLHDAAKETAGDLLIQRPIAILREDRRIPDGLAHLETKKQRNIRL